MILSSVVRYLHAWRRYNKTMRELSRLSDRELADIGMSRSELTGKAWESAQEVA
jgi:uncharacterized protein YjiS (DUF1127 family)